MDQDRIERRWKKLQAKLGYTDEELAIFRSNPKHAKIVENPSTFGKYMFIAEIIECHNCGAGHKVGDKFVFTDNMELLRDECPKQMCYSALTSLERNLFCLWERLASDLSVELFYDEAHCTDVGVRRGGFGEVRMRVYAVPRDQYVWVNKPENLIK
jgi:uncharacterized repeat protein (TIGR04076 family)